MPFYIYQAKEIDFSCEKCYNEMEVYQGILEESLLVCPHCGSPIERQIVLPSSIIVKGREANQYADIRKAKYWRDKNGVRHKVTAADGSSKSSTVSRQTASPQEVEARKKKARADAKKQRTSRSYNQYKQRVLRDKKQ